MRDMLLIVLAALTVAPGLARAQDTPEGGTSVLEDADFGGFSMGDPHPLGTTQPVSVEGMPFTKAIRTVGHPGAGNVWDFQLHVENATAVRKGDVLLASFWMRCVSSQEESGSGRTAFVFQHNGEPWTDHVSHQASAGREWQRFFVPFTSRENLEAGGALMALRLGYEPQTLEFGGMEVVNYGTTRTLEELPETKVTYEGMEKDAAWRVEAEERIQKHRTASLRVKVVDSDGRPVEDAEVEVKQTRSAFIWGTAVSAHLLTDNEQEEYQQVIKTWFNAAVIENALKSPSLAGDWGDGWGLDLATRAVGWLEEHALTRRGHVLVWPSWHNSPQAWKDLETDPAALREAVLAHIGRVAGALAGKMQHWDVLNEPYQNHDITRILGEDSLVDWFKAAAEADPDAKLYLNDFAILAGGRGGSGHRDHFETTARTLLSKGAPLQGLGMQGHFGAGLTSPDDLKKLLDRYAEIGLPILVTEYDIVIDDEELAGGYTRDFLISMYSHPAVEGVMLWGFWDGAHHAGNAPLVRKDWSLKPAGRMWQDLVRKEWKTEATRVSDAKGWTNVRAHLGEYRVLVRKGGLGARGTALLGEDGVDLTLTLAEIDLAPDVEGDPGLDRRRLPSSSRSLSRPLSTKIRTRIGTTIHTTMGPDHPFKRKDRDPWRLSAKVWHQGEGPFSAPPGDGNDPLPSPFRQIPCISPSQLNFFALIY